MKIIDVINELTHEHVDELGLVCDLYDEMEESDKQKLRDYVNVDTISKIEQVRDQDKNAGEYPYNRCIKIIKEGDC